jgi:uncharacterized membrane protein YagU involved in acid resistance
MFHEKFQKIMLDEILERGIPGAIPGLLGGSVFGIWMAEKGVLAAIASMVGSRSPLVGLAMHLAISTGIGISFAVLFSRPVEGTLPLALWGLVYGFVWWFLGPLTLMPIMMGMGPQWTALAVAAAIPSLIWHLVFGAIMGLAYTGLSLDFINLRRSVLH